MKKNEVDVLEARIVEIEGGLDLLNEKLDDCGGRSDVWVFFALGCIIGSVVSLLFYWILFVGVYL